MALDAQKKRCYDILGLKPDASQEAVRLAYKKLALQWHPDRHQDDKERAQEKFVEINDAYTVLTQDWDDAHPGAKPDVPNHKQARTPPCSAPTYSSTRSECGSESLTSSPPKHTHSGTRRSDGRPKVHTVPRAPMAATSSSSSGSYSGTEATRFQEHLSYIKVERHDRSELDPFGHKVFDCSYNPSGLEDDDFEFISAVDLGSPLRPLQIPRDDLAKVWIFPLPLTLEDLYHSATHHYRVTRLLQSGATRIVKIDVKVSPNWRTGTRIRVANVGNQLRDGSYQDIVFVVKEVPHPKFSRIGDDLYLTVHVPWSDARRATPYAVGADGARIVAQKSSQEEVYVQSLDGQEFELPIPRSLEAGADGSRVVGGGMPVHKNGKRVGKGDLFIKWVFTTPNPTKSRKGSWHTLRKAMVWRT